jgi:hypothetical protein
MRVQLVFRNVFGLLRGHVVLPKTRGGGFCSIRHVLHDRFAFHLDRKLRNKKEELYFRAWI